MSESFKCTWGPLNDRNLDAMSVEEIKEMLIDNFATTWTGSGPGDIDVSGPLGDDYVGLGLEPNWELGYYLCYTVTDKNDHETNWVAVYDETKLENYVESLAMINAAIGLYFPPEVAWEAIKTFMETGKMSDKLKWVNIDDLPEYVMY